MAEKETSKTIFQRVEKVINPHKIAYEAQFKEVDDGWDSLRTRRR